MTIYYRHLSLRFVAVFLLAFLILGCEPTATALTEQLHSPTPVTTPRVVAGQVEGGVGVNEIELGDSVDDVESRLGAPNELYELESDCARTYLHWFNSGEDDGNGIFAYANKGHVFQINIASPKYKTVNGIAFEMKLDEIRPKIDETYEFLELTDSESELYGGRNLVYIVSAKSGLAFEMWYSESMKSWFVAGIIVFPRGTQMVPSGCIAEWQKLIKIDGASLVS